MKSDEETSTNDSKEVTPDRTSEGTSSSNDAHLKAVDNTRGSDTSSRGGSSTPRDEPRLPVRTSKIVPKPRHRGDGTRGSRKFTKSEHLSSSLPEAPPPILSRERPPRISKDAPAALPETPPPSLSQEDDRVAPVTRKRMTTCGHDDVDFWTSAADVHNDVPARRTRTGSRQATITSAIQDQLRAAHAARSPIPPADPAATLTTDADGVEAAGPQALSAGSSADTCAPTSRRGRGRPPKKFPVAQQARPPSSAGDPAHVSGSDVRSSETDALSATERRHGRSVKPAVQVTSSVTQPPLTETPAVAKRLCDRPVERRGSTRAVLPDAELSTGPTGRPVGPEVPSTEEQAPVAPPAVSGVTRSLSRGGDKSTNTTDQSADCGPPQPGSTAPSDGLGAKPSIAAASQTTRGRPRKKYKAAKQLSKSHVTDAKSAAPAAPAGGSVAASTVCAAPAPDKLRENPPKESEASVPIDKEQGQSTSTGVDEKRPQRRSLRAVAPVSYHEDAAATPVTPRRQTPPPSAPVTPVPAASTGDRSNPALKDIITP